MNKPMVPIGTVAAMAASLLGQCEDLKENADIFKKYWGNYRDARVCQMVSLAMQIARETERQFDPQPSIIGSKHAQPQDHPDQKPSGPA